MATEWYFANAQNQQQGPVDAAQLAEAFRAGRVTADSLVWREGLAGWVALRTVASEIGLIVVTAPAPAAAPVGAVSTPQGRIVKPTGGGGVSGVLIAVCIGFVLIAVLGILAAIAIPAYQDYTVRAKVMQAVFAAEPIKAQVAEFYSAQDRCPKNGDEGFAKSGEFGLPNVSSVEIGPLKDSGNCAVRFTFKGLGASNTEGKRLLFSMDESQHWESSSELPARYLPASMRNK